MDAGDHTVAAADVGNILQITGGTATAGFYQITAVDTGNNRWTLDRSAGTSTQTVAGKMGGALATPGMLGKALNDHGVAEMRSWIKSGTYTLSTSTQNAAGGPLKIPLITVHKLEGYETTRGDRGARPVIDAGTETSVTLLTGSEHNSHAVTFINIDADGNSQSGVTGFSLGQQDAARLCKAIDCVTGFTLANAGSTFNCETDGCTTGFSGNVSSICVGCFALGGTTGFSNTNASICIAHGCTDGFEANATGQIAFSYCTSDGNSGDGFTAPSSLAARAMTCNSCVASNNGGYGFSGDRADRVKLINCAGYNNTSGHVDPSTLTTYVQDVTSLTADPYVDRANDDFRPNDTAGGGAELRAAGAGVPGQTANRDIGAVQHSDPAGGGGDPFPSQGIQSIETGVCA